MSSNYAAFAAPSLPPEVLAEPALSAVRDLYAEHAEAFDACTAADLAVEDVVAARTRARARYDHDGEAKALDAYKAAHAAATSARRDLASGHGRLMAEVAKNHDKIRRLVADALCGAHEEAVASVQHAQTADYRQRSALSSLRALDVMEAQRRVGANGREAALVASAIVSAYDHVLDTYDRSAPRRRNVTLSWRDIASSVGGLPVERLTALDTLTMVAPVLPDLDRRRNRAAALGEVA